MGGQNTKYALLMFFENVEIYALFGRTKWTQNLRWEDQNRFQGPGSRDRQADGMGQRNPFCYDY